MGTSDRRICFFFTIVKLDKNLPDIATAKRWIPSIEISYVSGSLIVLYHWSYVNQDLAAMNFEGEKK